MTKDLNKNNKRYALIEKTLLTGLGAVLSKGTINKAAITIYNDIQNELRILLAKLETKGELKTKETKKLVKNIKEKADKEKSVIYQELKKQSKPLLNNVKSMTSNFIDLLKNKKTTQPTQPTQPTTAKKKKTKRKKK